MASESNKYKLDRNAFKIRSFEEADDYVRNYKNYSFQERLSIALYLTSIAYQFDKNNPSRLDRNCFKMSKRN
ncbi:hypothetical protein [Parafilimonas terrae]|uniref:Uncharacterized protein n=1 Tax=Parafilimonas terrae TaxID=1465490 RepID=A0A1I5XNF7_9BACT|nr:hypothetical protein [Parafilimonas terrae]SFQ33450.1 hypothetical protein SAMN05444277_10966 [Parafilimonas terrae]